MNKSWKYRAITRTGREIRGSCVGEKSAMLDVLAAQRMHVFSFHRDYVRSVTQLLPSRQLPSTEMAQFFKDFHNMYSTGLGITPCLESIAETCGSARLKEIVSVLLREVSEGESLGNAASRARGFPWIVAAVLSTGEKSGRISEALEMLSHHFHRHQDVQSKLSQALAYPIIMFLVLTGVMFFISLNIVPRLQYLLPTDISSQGGARGILWLSTLVHDHWGVCISLPIVLLLVFVQRKADVEYWLYRVPAIGNMLKEHEFALYFANLSLLLKSGVGLIPAVDDLKVLDPGRVSHHFDTCKEYLISGLPLWEAVKKDPFFPSIVSFTLRRGEEMARLDEYCHHLSEYYSRRVAMNINRILHLVQPMLLLMGGLFLVLIAFSFLLPIYANLSKIAGN